MYFSGDTPQTPAPLKEPMDLRDAITLSFLPASVRQRFLSVLREALRSQARGQAPALEQWWRQAEPGGLVGAELLRAARAQAGHALDQARARQIEAIAYGQPAYPPALAAIPDPPPVLWVRGLARALSRPAVAVVGSRAASHYALDMAETLGAELASRGITVVSGLARGVDAAAHRGALSANVAEPVAVLGSGVDIIYPPEHADLAAAIAGRGALVAEVPPGAPPLPAHFPQRNRIISGLSLAVVVVEAPERSGALITARCALEQGRDVMAVPGNALTGRNRGGHGLLKDGAKVVEVADDIVEELGFASRRAGLPLEADAAADPVLGCMKPGESYDLDSLLHLTGQPSAAVLPRLLELELMGLVARSDGGRFRAVVRKVVT